jgi:hypothetical protein
LRFTPCQTEAWLKGATLDITNALFKYFIGADNYYSGVGKQKTHQNLIN